MSQAAEPQNVRSNDLAEKESFTKSHSAAHAGGSSSSACRSGFHLALVRLENVPASPVLKKKKKKVYK